MRDIRFKEPIRNKKKITQMRKWLLNNSVGRQRDEMLFRFGLNTALRISDILRIKGRDVYDEKGNVNGHIVLRDKKTGKINKINIPPKFKEVLEEYNKVFEFEPGDYLFFSLNKENMPLERTQAWRILKKAARACKINNFGTHSMRKTKAYWLYRETHDLYLVMDLLNHSRESVTLRYIGYSQDEKDKAHSKVFF